MSAIHDVYRTDSKHLAELIGLRNEGARLWSAEELGAMLRHQWNSLLDFDLGDVTPDAKATLVASRVNTSEPSQTFADLFRQPHPPVSLLKLAKEFGKRHRTDPESPLPREISTLLYYLSIVVALARCNERITELTDADLRKGIEWAIAQPWMDDATRALLQEGMKRMHTLKL